jgi:hypothetical protein
MSGTKQHSGGGMGYQGMGIAKENESPVSGLLAYLTQQQEPLSLQKQRLEGQSSGDTSSEATDPYGNTEPAAHSSGRPDAAEVLRLQKQLELARERMAQMDLELAQSRIAKHTVEEAIGSPFPAAQQLALDIGSGTGSITYGRSTPHHGFASVQHFPPPSRSFDGRHVASNL